MLAATEAASRPAVAARRPALLFANGLGDHLLALPAVRALGTLFPGRLTLVGGKKVGRLFFADVPFRAAFAPPMRPTDDRAGLLFDAEAVARSVGDCDLLLSLNPWHSPSVDALLDRLAPAHSVGYLPGFADVLPYVEARHAADLAFDLPRRLDPALAIGDFVAPPALPAEAVAWAARLRAGLPPGRRLLAVHADTRPEKSWPPERFVALLDAFLARHRDFVALVVGQRDLGLAGGRQGRRVVPLLGLPLGHALAAVGAADLFVGVDSVMLHAADLAGVPGVGLFRPPRGAWGNDSAASFGFRFGPHRHVCGGGAMVLIEPDAVLDALESLASDGLRRRGAAPPAEGRR